MKLLMKSFFVFLFLSSLVFAQNNFSLSGRVGLIKTYGTAEGFELSAKRFINSNFLFQITAGYYGWSESKDLNSIYIVPSNISNYTIKEIDNLVPVRVGFSYLFGDKPSRPFFSIEWAVNRTNFNYNEITFVTDANGYLNRHQNKFSKSTLFVSMGFSMGYSFALQENMNLLTGIFYQTGDEFTYTGFIAGLEYGL